MQCNEFLALFRFLLTLGPRLCLGERGCGVGECRSSLVASGEGVAISYARPRVLTVASADQHNASTRGGNAVTLTGYFFGARGSVPVTVLTKSGVLYTIVSL